MRQITVDQSHQVLATLATNTDWSSVDFEGSNLQELVIRNPKEAGRQFTLFLKNGGKLIVGGPKTISFDRTKPFNPAEFIGDGWSIVEEDKRSLALTKLDLSKVRFETMLKENETSITGEQKLKRLKKAGHVRLDAKVFQTLWENQSLIPESWKEKTNGNTTFIYFDGTVLQNPCGHRYVLCLYWNDGKWRWFYSWLDRLCCVDIPSLVLDK
jgi:hypothetical protein